MTTNVKYNVRWKIFIPIILAILAILGGLTFFVHKAILQSDDYVLKKPFYMLLIGMDLNIGEPNAPADEMTRTDTLILAVMDPYKTKITLISIPRDTLVNIPGVGVDRINRASVEGGYKLTSQMVSDLMGVQIDKYAVVNFESFKQLVDLVGGVEVDVDKVMRYADEYGVDKIKLDPGPQILNGDKALQFVRFRAEPLGDISRVERQRKFLMALFKKLKQPQNILKVPQLLDIAHKYVKTDMSSKEMVKLMNFTRTVNSQGIESHTLPGEFSDVYWKPHPDEIAQLMQSIKPVPTTVPSRK